MPDRAQTKGTELVLMECGCWFNEVEQVFVDLCDEHWAEETAVLLSK